MSDTVSEAEAGAPHVAPLDAEVNTSENIARDLDAIAASLNGADPEASEGEEAPETSETPDGEETPKAEAEAEAEAETEKAAAEAQKLADDKEAARRFAAMRKERQAQRERETALAEREAEMAKKFEHDRRMAELVKADPMAFMRENGITMKDVAEQALQSEVDNPQQKELAELREELDALKKFKDEQTAATQETQLQQQRNDWHKAVQEDFEPHRDKFPLLSGESPETLTREVLYAVNQYEEQFQQRPSDTYQIYDALEKARYKQYQSFHSRLNATPPTSNGEKPATPSGVPVPENRESSPTISAVEAAQSASPPRDETSAERMARIINSTLKFNR